MSLKTVTPSTAPLATAARASPLADLLSTAISTTIATMPGLLLACVLSSGAFAADASSWDGDSRSAIRLVAGGPSGDRLRAGLEVRLANGWKTYWRYPGDSGVPPVFDFSRSENVSSVSILWPAPHRFSEEGGASIGYKSDVMFPIHVVPNDPGRPATLRLAVNYAICEKLCVPAHGEAELALASAPSPSPYDSRLAAAESLTPKPAGIGENIGDRPLGVTAVRLEPGQPHPRVVVEVTAPPDKPLDLFAEGPTAEWGLPLPSPVPGAPPGRRWFAFDLDGAPPGVDGTGAPLRFTLVSGENAVEVTAVPK